MRLPTYFCLLSCLVLSTGVSALAQAPQDPGRNETMLAAGFLEGHPDLLYRKQGLDAYGSRDYATAMERFRKAAHFGDKASQAIIGEMLWSGVGVAPDRVMALAWMDLAAERGYPRFVNTRNGYWNALAPPERQLARDQVERLYAEYGDSVAEPRLAQVLRRERSKMSGSRVGSQTSNVQIVVPGQGSMDASQFYDPKYWDPKQYRAWHDAFWENVREGKVDVGDPERLDEIKVVPPVIRPPQGEPR